MSFFKKMLGGHHGSGGHGSNGGRHGQYNQGVPPTDTGGTSCPSCRVMNPGNARFCRQCGTSLVPAACAQCGSVMVAGAKFCAQCGTASA